LEGKDKSDGRKMEELVKVVLQLVTAPYAPEQHYGVFDSMYEAQQWIEKQPQELKFNLIFVRNKQRYRPKSSDWYYQMDDKDFFAEWEA
jgi:KaiC/GvpD/RAD55 family RecA-like ATPase